MGVIHEYPDKGGSGYKVVWTVITGGRKGRSPLWVQKMGDISMHNLVSCIQGVCMWGL